MRVAFVQGGEGLESIEDQIARLKPLGPDIYHIEENPTGLATQRLLERLEALKPGDALCVAGLEALRMEAAEAASLIAELLARGVHVLLAQPDNTLLDLGSSDRDAQLATAFAELLPRRKSALDPLKADASRALLTAAEIEDVRRLSKAGLSPRRIGLIYRRSPKCISDILWGREPDTPEPWMMRRHKTS